MTLIAALTFCVLSITGNYHKHKPDPVPEPVDDNYDIFDAWVRDTNRRGAWTGERISLQGYLRHCDYVDQTVQVKA